MKWRYFKLDWKYAVGELAIVTVGVLIALGVDQWRQEQADRSAANQYIGRLIDDVERDIEAWDLFQSRLTDKLAALDGAQAWLENSDMEIHSLDIFLENIVNGAIRGYGGMISSRNTFDELISTGQFGLIDDVALREIISGYYITTQNQARRISERITTYPSTIYQLVPRENEYTVSMSLSSQEKVAIANRAKTLDLQWLIIGERNFGLEMNRVVDLFQTQTADLSSQLKNKLE